MDVSEVTRFEGDVTETAHLRRRLVSPPCPTLQPPAATMVQYYPLVTSYNYVIACFATKYKGLIFSSNPKWVRRPG